MTLPDAAVPRLVALVPEWLDDVRGSRWRRLPPLWSMLKQARLTAPSRLTASGVACARVQTFALDASWRSGLCGSVRGGGTTHDRLRLNDRSRFR
jgi:hypothetical protein